MIRIHGVNLPDQKRIDYALTLIYGIGWNNVKKILKTAAVSELKKVGELNEQELKQVIAAIDAGHRVEGVLKEEISNNIKRLRAIGSYRGIRHGRGLPVRGQRTKSNARTKRGKRKTVGALKKEDMAKIQQSTQTGKK